MIEGLRVLPFWQTVTEGPDNPLRDCKSCQESRGLAERQLMRCGMIPRVDSVGGMPSRGFPFGKSTAETCPGYTTSMPEVAEVALAHPQYKAGYLAEFLGEAPSPEILYGCAILDRAHAAWEADEMRKRQEEQARGR